MSASIGSQRGYAFKSFKYSSHYSILKKLEREPQPLRILDVGCASGYLGKVLRENGHYVIGIDADRGAATSARAYYDVFHLTDIETFDFPYRHEFDYLLFADVLEHLRDPLAVLRRAIPTLVNSGKLIVSVPNIANWTVRLKLLFGNFDPAERGILDKTHLHFFTLRSLKKMMREASCRVLDVTPTPVPIQLVFPFTQSKAFAALHALHYGLTLSWRSLFAYQFVLTAAPEARARASKANEAPAEMASA
ncbi:MAG TPA: class I SAM-dependent methyltransferase [Candidatus Acidoferrales bacterium]|nr:class I SAM-dependent methyltransferase [Candidatus Acidoferrales bacterium]